MTPAVASQRLIAKDPVMKKILDIIDRVAAVKSNILLQGESGTGKSFLAKYIHSVSSRSANPFIEIDCTTIPRELLESELFGHEQGAFTDAGEIKKGRFELADTGTVFIDMVCEIPLFLQGKLLRVIQERCFERLGGTASISVDIRIIASSNRDLWSMVEVGQFREDLFYRLNVVPIDLPPLRERISDIPLLARYFLAKYRAEYSKSCKCFSPEALETLKNRDWPGNVRQLENMIERITVSYGDSVEISRSMLSAVTSEGIPRITESTQSKLMNLDEVEKAYIERILYITGNHMTKAASILGINRKTLLMKRKKFGI